MFHPMYPIFLSCNGHINHSPIPVHVVCGNAPSSESYLKRMTDSSDIHPAPGQLQSTIKTVNARPFAMSTPTSFINRIQRITISCPFPPATGSCHVLNAELKVPARSTWAADLLVQYLKIFEQHLHLLEQSNRMVISDGGVKEVTGYFNVVIAVGDTIIAGARGAVCAGDARTMCSFCEDVCTFLQVCACFVSSHQQPQTKRRTRSTMTAQVFWLGWPVLSEYVPLRFWTKPESDRRSATNRRRIPTPPRTPKILCQRPSRYC
jgi:hypothetical protein